MTDVYGIDNRYTSRMIPLEMNHQDNSGVIYQPDVYPMVRFLQHVVGAIRIVDLGCGSGEKLVEISDDVECVGVDTEKAIEICRSRHGDRVVWGVCNLCDGDDIGGLPLTGAVVSCVDVIEHLPDPLPLLESLLESDFVAALITTPDREKVYPGVNLGPPGNGSHVREWTKAELEGLLGRLGFDHYVTYTRANNSHHRMSTLVAVLRGNF